MIQGGSDSRRGLRNRSSWIYEYYNRFQEVVHGIAISRARIEHVGQELVHDEGDGDSKQRKISVSRRVYRGMFKYIFLQYSLHTPSCKNPMRMMGRGRQTHGPGEWHILPI